MAGIKKRIYYHSLLTSIDAEAILQEKKQNSFLLRRNIHRDIIISYKCEKQKIKHVRLPKQNSNKILQRNPHLDSPGSLLDYILTKANQILSYPVSREIQKKSSDSSQTWKLARINQCEICAFKVGINEKRRHKHLENHHRITECSSCGLILFPFQHQTHKQECRPETIRIYDCKSCSFSTKKKSYLNKHEDGCLLKTFICDFCDKKFYTEDKKMKHQTDIHSTIFPCPHCEKTFTSLNSRKFHESTSHVLVDNKMMIQCTVCHTIYENQTELKRHMRVHKFGLKVGPFICQNCDKIFSSHYTLKTHKKALICQKVHNTDIFIGI